MPDTTPIYALPYPADGDSLASAVKTIPKALAEKLETTVATLTGYSPGSPPLFRDGNATVTVAADRRFTITYATPFPTATRSIVIQQRGTYNAPYGALNFMVESSTRFGAVVMCNVASLSNLTLSYIATGN